MASHDANRSTVIRAREQFDRRDFLKVSAGGLICATNGLAFANEARSQPFCASHDGDSETLVHQLHESLTDVQRQAICFEFDDPLRAKVDANWNITKLRIAHDFNADQQDLVRQIFLKLHSDEYADQVWKQVEHDGAGADGFGGCSIALFGKPGQGKFEFVLTGRHVTRRCDGDSVEGTAFGGPIFYGHAAESFDESADHPGNIYWYQARRANELFQALDGKQRKVALLSDSRGEHGSETVKFQERQGNFQGIPTSDLTADQTALAKLVMSDLLAPFREQDRRETMKLIESAGFDKLHFSYFQNENIGNDQVWDVWQVEGPNCIWYFRGKPHVHAWVHVRKNT